MKVVCDNCRKEFTISMLNKKIDTGVYLCYIKCYHCKSKFIAYYENTKLRQNKEKITKLRNKKNTENEIKDLILENNKIKDELKQKYSKMETRDNG